MLRGNVATFLLVFLLGTACSGREGKDDKVEEKTEETSVVSRSVPVEVVVANRQTIRDVLVALLARPPHCPLDCPRRVSTANLTL